MNDAADKKIKSGKKIIEDFINDLKRSDSLNSDIRDRLILLYEKNKFTDKNILNALSEIREGVIKNDQN